MASTPDTVAVKKEEVEKNGKQKAAKETEIHTKEVLISTNHKQTAESIRYVTKNITGTMDVKGLTKGFVIVEVMFPG